MAYTHDFEFILGSGGAKEFSGEAEFNVDEATSFVPSEAWPNLTVSQANLLNRLFELLGNLSRTFEGMEKIEVVSK